MELKWMGRYRELVRALIYYSNSSNRGMFKKTLNPVNGIALSKPEYQILEYLCEFENESKIMADIAHDLGSIYAGSFTIAMLYTMMTVANTMFLASVLG